MGFFSRPDDPQNLLSGGPVDDALQSSSHPYAYILTVSIGVFFIIVLLWASIAKMDDIARGTGAVIPAAGIVPVQSERGGKIVKIYVKENDYVEKDDLVVSLSSIEELSSLRDLKNKSIELALAIIRLEAESLNQDLFYTDDIESMYPEVVQAQRALFNSRRQQFLGEIEQLEAQIEQRGEEVKEMQNKKQQTTDNLVILRERLGKVEKLVGTAVTQIDYLDLQNEIVTKEGELSNAKQGIARAQSGELAAKEHLKNREAEWQSQIAEELNKDRMELDAVHERLKVSNEQVSNTELHAPVAGTIKQVLLKKDGVAKPAESILEIIPSNGTLEIEAKFSPQDRGFLYVDQEAMIKFSSYDFSIYGGLEAVITRISQDTIEDKKGGTWFEVRLVTKTPALYYMGQELEIHPGMTVSVDVVTDKRTVLAAMLRPIKNAMSSAMTER